jgi:hypothetical protein
LGGKEILVNWTTQENQDKTIFWTKKVGLMHVAVVEDPDAARRVYVWASEYPEVGWDLVYMAKTVPAAKAWAERTYS